jgi:hypothetical protein
MPNGPASITYYEILFHHHERGKKNVTKKKGKNEQKEEASGAYSVYLTWTDPN